MSDPSLITNSLTVVVLLFIFVSKDSRWLPARTPVRKTVWATSLAASLIALAVRTFTLLAPNVARGLNPAWYALELAVVSLLVGAACGAWIVDRRLGPLSGSEG